MLWELVSGRDSGGREGEYEARVVDEAEEIVLSESLGVLSTETRLL